MSMRTAGVLVLIVTTGAFATACKRRHHDPILLPSPSATASALTDDERGQKLEQAFSAAEKAHPGGFPPCGPGVKGPCEQQTVSEIGVIRGNAVASQGDKLPPAIHAHGEALRGAWVAPDGTEFLVGYNYTGVPGPDTGVVYRKDPNGDWKIVYSKRENELGHIWGRHVKDVWAAGVKTLVHWDGMNWKEETIPVFDGGNLAGVWGTDTELYVVGGPGAPKGDGGRIFRRDAKGNWTVDAHTQSFLFDIGGKGTTIVAVGQDGQIMRRKAANSWVNEGADTSTNEHVYIASDHDMFVSGHALYRSKGDGMWTRETLPTKSQARDVWGRSATDVYVGTLGGLYHLDGGRWKATDWTHEVGVLAGNADIALVANQRMVR